MSAEHATITEEPTWAEEAERAIARIIEDRRKAWDAYLATKATLEAAEKRAEQAEEAALKAGNLVRALSRQIEREISRGRLWQPDHACAECVPDGEILIPGFRCARHAALLIAAEPGEADQ